MENIFVKYKLCKSYSLNKIFCLSLSFSVIIEINESFVPVSGAQGFGILTYIIELGTFSLPIISEEKLQCCFPLKRLLCLVDIITLSYFCNLKNP